MSRAYLFVRWFFGLPKEEHEYARIDLTDWRAMKPGDVRVLRDQEGNAWGVMQLDDFDHIMDLAKLQRRESSAVPTTAPQEKP